MSRRPAPVRLPVAIFTRFARIMPRRFREEWLRDAARDLEGALEERYAARGARAAWAAGGRAALDLVRRIPIEWWAAMRGRGGDARVCGPRMGNEIMNGWIELRQAARALARRPGFSGATTLTLALGIGANVAIFAVVNAVLLRPLPYPEADRIVVIRHHAPGLDLNLDVSHGMMNFYRAQGETFAGLAAFDPRQRNLLGGPSPERVELTAVTPEIFDVLRVRPAMGRPFGPADVEEGATPVTILTDAAWKTRFGSDPNILGQTIRVDDVVTEIVGVMPRGFAFPDPDAVALVPLRIDPEGDFGTFGLSPLARIPDGMSPDQFSRRAEEVQTRLPDFFPDLSEAFLERAGWSVSILRYQDTVVGTGIASALWIVLATVGIVLLIACANVANLFLVRAESRQKELAVRAAMGAGSGRLAMGFLAESLLLGLAGGILGVALAWSGLELLVAGGPSALPRLHELSMDGTTMGFGATLSLATALLLGTFPLVRHRSGRISRVLRDGGRTATEGRAQHRARNVLVAGQLALALVLLVASGLMLRSFQALRSVDPGFDGTDVFTVGLNLVEGVDNDVAARFYAEVLDRVEELPGVREAALTSLVPLGEGSANAGSFYIEGVERTDDDIPPVAWYKVVGGDYLETMRQPLVQGRALTRADWQPGAEPVMLVNEAFRDQHLGGEAIGRGIRWDEEGSFARIVGVVGDAREREIREEQGPWAYLPMRVAEWGYPNLRRMHVMVRGSPNVEAPVGAIRSIVAELDPSVPITSVRTMDEILSRSMADTSFTMVLLGIAAAVALFLGAIGLFGVISYVVGQRTREIGVRVALGARREDIRALVFRQGVVVATAGMTIGLLGAASLTRLMESVLFEVSPIDPLSFLAAPVLLLAVAVTATWLPARRAIRVDPLVALRAE